MSDIDLIFEEEKDTTREFEYKGKKVVIVTKPLGWSKKNKIVGQCFPIVNGQISFDYSKYNSLVLKEIITSMKIGDSVVPPNEINEIMFSRISSAFGSILDSLIPKAFEDNNSNTDFLAKKPLES